MEKELTDAISLNKTEKQMIEEEGGITSKEYHARASKETEEKKIIEELTESFSNFIKEAEEKGIEGLLEEIRIFKDIKEDIKKLKTNKKNKDSIDILNIFIVFLDKGIKRMNSLVEYYIKTKKKKFNFNKF